MKIDKILVPVDFSTHSVDALQFALEFAERFCAEIHLLHVFPEALLTPPPYGPVLPTDYRVEIEQAAKQHFIEWQGENCPDGIACDAEESESQDDERNGIIQGREIPKRDVLSFKCLVFALSARGPFVPRQDLGGTFLFSGQR